MWLLRLSSLITSIYLSPNLGTAYSLSLQLDRVPVHAATIEYLTSNFGLSPGVEEACLYHSLHLNEPGQKLSWLLKCAGNDRKFLHIWEFHLCDVIIFDSLLICIICIYSCTYLFSFVDELYLPASVCACVWWKSCGPNYIIDRIMPQPPLIPIELSGLAKISANQIFKRKSYSIQNLTLTKYW